MIFASRQGLRYLDNKKKERLRSSGTTKCVLLADLSFQLSML